MLIIFLTIMMFLPFCHSVLWIEVTVTNTDCKTLGVRKCKTCSATETVLTYVTTVGGSVIGMVRSLHRLVEFT
jgi:hypothetical protein